MCGVLQIPKSSFYYKAKEPVKSEEELTAAILETFQKSRQNYGTRKIKKGLKKRGVVASRSVLAGS